MLSKSVLFAFVLSIAGTAWGQTINNTVTIDANTSYQNMIGWGAAAAYYINPSNLPSDPQEKERLFDLAFRQHWGNVLRLRLPYTLEWNNDDGDPASLGPSALTNPNDPVLNQFNWNHPDIFAIREIVQAFRARGGKYVFASSWTPPLWMKQGATPGMPTQGGSIPPGVMEDEFAEWIAAFVAGMQSKHGVTIDGISIQNEPNLTGLSESLAVNATQYLTLFLKTAQRLRNLGLNTAMLGPDTANIVGFPYGATGGGYVQRLTASATAMQYLTAVITHQYGDPCECSPSVWQGFRAAVPAQIPILMSEMSRFSFGSDDLADALETFDWMHVALASGNVNGWLYWGYWWPPEASLPDTAPFETGGLLRASSHSLTVPPRYQAFRHLAAHVPEGSRRIKTTGGQNLKTLAFLKPGGDRREIVVVASNNSATNTVLTTLQLGQTPSGPVTMFRTSASESHTLLPSPAPAGPNLIVSIPPKSMITLAIPMGLTVPEGLDLIATPDVLGPNDDLRLRLRATAPIGSAQQSALALVWKMDDPASILALPNLGASLDPIPLPMDGSALEIVVPAGALPAGRYQAIGIVFDAATAQPFGTLSNATFIQE